jgi:hydroxypyruvate isomerase
MLQFSANLTMLYSEFPFLERFAKAKSAGFQAVEFQFPYSVSAEMIRQAQTELGLQIALFNLPAGDFERGERGIAIYPDRREEFREGVDQAIHYAVSLDCTRLNCLSGKMTDDLALDDAWSVLCENLLYAARKLEEKEIALLVEPINRYDIPGFFLSDMGQTRRLLQEVGHSNLQIQYDFYHVQRMQGELLVTFAELQGSIGHVQIADNPGRHQPGTGEIHYPNIFKFIEKSGYKGYIGLEYIPQGDTDKSLAWLVDFVQRGD